MVHWAVCVIMT